jgi:hypothetical protein
MTLMKGGLGLKHEGHAANKVLVVSLSLELAEKHNDQTFHDRCNCAEILKRS